MQKCSPGCRAGWPRFPGFPSLSAPIPGRDPFSRPFSPSWRRLWCQHVGGGGQAPPAPHPAPAAGSARPALPLPSKLHGLARIVFVLARGLMCQSQDRVSLAPCVFSCPKSLWRTSIPRARGGCSWWGCSGRGWEIWHLCAPSLGCHGDRTSLVVIAWSWPVVQAAHRKGDTAPGVWLLRHRGQCASPVPPASTLSPPTPSPPRPYAEVPEVPCQL